MSDLSLTAMYTSATWAWGRLPNADLLVTPEAERVFRMVNGALGMTQRFTGAPSLKHSLLERHRILDELLKTSGVSRVVELAAGLSRRGVTVTEDPKLRYIEVDLPAVVEAKRKILRATARGSEVLARPNFEMIAGDVSTFDFDSLFRNSRDPIFVIAEGLLMYLDEVAQNKLFGAIYSRLNKGGGHFAFDLVPASEQRKPGAVGRGLGKAMKFFTRGGEFVRDERTRHDIAHELEQHGFDSVNLLGPSVNTSADAAPNGSPTLEQLVFHCRAKSTD